MLGGDRLSERVAVTFVRDQDLDLMAEISGFL